MRWERWAIDIFKGPGIRDRYRIEGDTVKDQDLTQEDTNIGIGHQGILVDTEEKLRRDRTMGIKGLSLNHEDAHTQVQEEGRSSLDHMKGESRFLTSHIIREEVAEEGDD